MDPPPLSRQPDCAHCGCEWHHYLSCECGCTYWIGVNLAEIPSGDMATG